MNSGVETGSGDDDITIPRAAMNKMIKETCPNIRVANDARELVLSCCTEFIQLVSTEANEECAKQQKKTINAEHVLSALDALGYEDFKEDCAEVLKECKDVAAKRRRQSTRLENLGIPEEELLRQQQELFARARAAAAEQEIAFATQLATQQQNYLQQQQSFNDTLNTAAQNPQQTFYVPPKKSNSPPPPLNTQTNSSVKEEPIDNENS